MDARLRAVVEEFVAARFAAADNVIVGGSTSRGTRTASSDIDLLLIGPASMFDDGAASLACTLEHGGEAIEVFAYTPETFREWASKDFDAGRPVLARLLVEGTVLRNDESLRDIRSWIEERLAAGPQLTQHDLDLRRYRLTDLADDLADAIDPFEIAVVKATFALHLAEFALLANGEWLGSGKWLARRVLEWNPRVADDLTEAMRVADPAPLLRLFDDLLAPHGGRLHTGFVR